MAWLFAMTIPGLVVALVLLGAWDRLGARARGRRRRSAESAAASGYDLFQTVFSPGRQHELDRRRTEWLWREDDEEGQQVRRSRVDLDAGVARLHLRRDPGAEARH